jgi:hypothetical protein
MGALFPMDATELQFEGIELPLAVVFETTTPIEVAESRLTRIGNAIHKYLGTLGYFPPSIVRGPDGTPWHSWRVLILPYLGEDEHKLFQEYDLSKPWNDEHNLKLVQKMPDVYRDPTIQPGRVTYAHFAVATDVGTVFPNEGCILPNEFRIETFSKPLHTLRYPPNKVYFPRHLTDGSANTILVGTARLDDESPWTQPVDVTLGPQPRLDNPGGFVASYLDGDIPVALFVFADGRVDRVPATISGEILRALFTAGGRERIRAGMTPKSPEYPGYLRPVNYRIEIREQARSTNAYIVRDAEG